MGHSIKGRMTRMRPDSAAAIRRPMEQSARASGYYVEYEDGTREYHDRTSDPYELQNTFWSLTPVTRQSLHSALAALQDCQGAQACWESTFFPSTSPAK